MSGTERGKSGSAAPSITCRRSPHRLCTCREATRGGCEAGLLDDGDGGVELRVRHLEDELVVHLQQHASGQAAGAQRGLHAHHGALDDVRRRALDGGVDGLALGVAAQRPRLVDVDKVAPASEEGLHEALLPGLLPRPSHVVLYAGVALEVGLDVAARVWHGDAQALGQPEGALPVDDAEVDGLGLSAHVGRHLVQRHPEHLRGGEGVHVDAGAEGVLQRGDARHVRQQPQLDLRVVGRHQRAPLLRNKRLPQRLPEAHRRDVLEVGVDAA
mmetsp:Transcript_39909/g.106632  ORF Transcript_39909/g.106632 Transcript_39909/m.106632 type:complete len:271 (-) Transcript_39909:392-1204(-)